MTYSSSIFILYLPFRCNEGVLMRYALTRDWYSIHNQYWYYLIPEAVMLSTVFLTDYYYLYSDSPTVLTMCVREMTVLYVDILITVNAYDLHLPGPTVRYFRQCPIGNKWFQLIFSIYWCADGIYSANLRPATFDTDCRCYWYHYWHCNTVSIGCVIHLVSYYSMTSIQMSIIMKRSIVYYCCWYLLYYSIEVVFYIVFWWYVSLDWYNNEETHYSVAQWRIIHSDYSLQ